MRSRVLMLGLAAIVALAGAAVAEEAGPYTWVSFIKAQPGQGEALVKLMIEQNSEVYNGLVDSGAALEWGIAMPIFHDGNDPASHGEWITFADWSGADAFMKSFMAKQGAKSEEQKMGEMEQWKATVVPGSHADAVHHMVHMGEPSGARPGYINVSFYKARFGKGSEAGKMWKEVAQPVYGQLQTDGAILNYGLFVPEIHRGQEWTHMSFYTSEGLAARDAVSKAFDAADAARSEEENKAIMEGFMEAFEEGGHSDQAYLVVHYYSGAGE